MTLRSSAVVAFVVLGSLVASRAEAGWGLRNSFGQGIYLAEPQPTQKVDVSTVDAAGQTVVNVGSNLAKGCIQAGNNKAYCYDGNRRKPFDFEIMPYYSFGLISIDLGIGFNLEQRTDLGFDFHFKPGVRIFPFMGLFLRGFIDLTAAQIAAITNSTGSIQASFEGHLGVGAGWQFKLGPWGIFAEFSFQPRLWGNGNRFDMPIEFRLGILLEP